MFSNPKKPIAYLNALHRIVSRIGYLLGWHTLQSHQSIAEWTQIVVGKHFTNNVKLLAKLLLDRNQLRCPKMASFVHANCEFSNGKSVCSAISIKLENGVPAGKIYLCIYNALLPTIILASLMWLYRYLSASLYPQRITTKFHFRLMTSKRTVVAFDKITIRLFILYTLCCIELNTKQWLFIMCNAQWM